MPKGKKKLSNTRPIATTSIPPKAIPETHTLDKPQEIQKASTILNSTSATIPNKASILNENDSQTEDDFESKVIQPLPKPLPANPNAAMIVLQFEDEERLIIKLKSIEEPVYLPQVSTRFGLETVYETLCKEGFHVDDVQKAMSYYGGNVTNCFNWLCLNVTSDKLPVNYFTPSNKPLEKPKKPVHSLNTPEKPPQSHMTFRKTKEIIMLEDFNKKQDEERLNLEDKQKLPEQLQLYRDLAAKARKEGNFEESKRLGKIIQQFQYPEAPKLKSEVPIQAGAQLNQESQIGSNYQSDNQVSVDDHLLAQLSKDEQEQLFRSKSKNYNQEGSDKDESDSLPQFLFDEEEQEETKITLSKVTYGKERFAGTIAKNWSGPKPKTLVGQLLRKKGFEYIHYYKGQDLVWRLAISPNENDKKHLIVFESDKICEDDSIGQEYVATLALYKLFAERFSIETQLPPDFKRLWKDWVDEDMKLMKKLFLFFIIMYIFKSFFA